MTSIRPKMPPRRRERVVLATALLLAVTLVMTLGATTAAQAVPTTFTVTNTSDSGEGSLRDAIEDANGNANPAEQDTIEFDIPAATDLGCDAASGVCTISPTSELPEIAQSVVIDGYSQEGASANTLATGSDAVLKIELDGSLDATDEPGITITGPNSVVRGLVVNNWDDDGIEISGDGATGNSVEGNYVGTDASGTQALGNGDDGVEIYEAPNNAVGGSSPAARNVISGNGDSNVYVFGSEASGNRIEGNYVGTDASGTQALVNDDGVYIEGAPNSTVGGTTEGARNVISGNGDEGVRVDGTGASGNRIQGNYIGTDASGTADLGNGGIGVFIVFAQNNTVGGTTASARNVISGNGDDGVEVDSGTNDRVQGNYIGTDASGTQPLGNDDGGVSIEFSTNTLVGGSTAPAANTIAFNGDDGVRVFSPSSTGNSILRNSIHSNVELGIDLGNDGVTANDPQDPDPGPNLLQNYPVITSASTPNGRSISVQGTLNSNPNESFIVQLFSSPEADPSGFGEGKTYLGQTTVTANAGGNAVFSFSANVPVAAGEFVTATATNTQTGDTSEFSEAFEVQDDTSPTVVSTNPRNGATGVPARTDVFATFSEAMNPSTINQNTFKLFRQEEGGGQTLVPSTVSYNEDARRGRLDPNANLTPGARYVATVTERARDLAGNGLAQRKTFYFVVAR